MQFITILCAMIIFSVTKPCAIIIIMYGENSCVNKNYVFVMLKLQSLCNRTVI